MKKIKSLEQVYKYLNRYDEIKMYNLRYEKNKLELQFSDDTFIVCNGTQIKIVTDDKMIYKYNLNYNQIYFFLLKTINKKEIIILQQKQEYMADIVSTFYTISLGIMLYNAYKMKLPNAVKFCIIYILALLGIYVAGKSIYKIYQSIKLRNIDKKDVEIVKKYISLTESSNITKYQLELYFEYLNSISKQFLKQTKVLSTDKKLELCQSQFDKTLNQINDNEIKKELKDYYNIYTSTLNTIFKYYDENGNKRNE